MKQNPDQALLERARCFESQALEEVFDTYSPKIYRYAYRLLGDEELASECMSETFSRFLGALQRNGGPNAYLQAYLFRIAHNWVTDYYRSKTPPNLPLEEDLLAGPDGDPHQNLTNHLTAQRIREALMLLTHEQRQAVSLKYLEEWENDAIAHAMNKPVGAVKALQHRGLGALRRILAGNKDDVV
jgi:RNA polymerase sigma-70 factor (ECF subfamily)